MFITQHCYCFLIACLQGPTRAIQKKKEKDTRPICLLIARTTSQGAEVLVNNLIVKRLKMQESFQVIVFKHVGMLSCQFSASMTEFTAQRRHHLNPLTLHSPCVCGKVAKKALRRAASHSMLSCRLARAFRSLTSRRISFWGISLSPRFPVSTSDSLAKATLKKERKKEGEEENR